MGIQPNNKNVSNNIGFNKESMWSTGIPAGCLQPMALFENRRPSKLDGLIGIINHGRDLILVPEKMFQHKIIVNLISGYPPFSDRAFYKTLPLTNLLRNCVPLVPCPYWKPIWILPATSSWFFAKLLGHWAIQLMEVLGTSASQFTHVHSHCKNDPISMTCGPDWWIWTSWSLCWIAKVWFRLGPRIRSDRKMRIEMTNKKTMMVDDDWWLLMMIDDYCSYCCCCCCWQCGGVDL